MRRLIVRVFVRDPGSPLPAASSAAPAALLTRKRWDDFGHSTLFDLELLTNNKRVRIGLTKIIHLELPTTPVPDSFEVLPPGFYSQLQRAYSYKSDEEKPSLCKLLTVLRDLAFVGGDERATAIANDLSALTLLRFTTARYALESQIGQRPSSIQFSVTHKVEGFQEAHEVEFHFDSEAMLGRMVVLVGQNGAGKTRFLYGLHHPLLGIRPKLLDGSGRPTLKGVAPAFSTVIQMSFSAFDPFPLTRSPALLELTRYCGLRRLREDWSSASLIDIEDSFRALDKAVAQIKDRGREELWRQALASHRLNFSDGEFSSWLLQRSAGQKFVGFVLTHLYAAIEPGALLIFDEPEIHTHPTMLSLLMRQIHELLEQFDAFAILATHSPIVLQETPGRQVRVMQREGGYPLVTRYPGECFGEGLDEIMRTGLELGPRQRNFTHHIKRLANERGIEAVEHELPNMGIPARLALRSTGSSNDVQDEDGELC